MSKKTPFNPRSSADRIIFLQQKLQQARNFVRGFLERYPLYFLSGMLICLLASGILAFTVMRKEATHRIPVFPKAPASGTLSGLSGVMGSYDALQQVTAIQDTIAAIIAKESLNTSDSIRLTDALKRFEQLQKTIYHQNYTP